MNLLSTPVEIIHRAMQGVFGRAFCFAAACILGRVVGVFVTELWSVFFFSLAKESGDPPVSFDWDWERLWEAALFIPIIGPQFTMFEITMTAFCAIFAFVFIRFELSARWLLLPFVSMLVGYVQAHTVW